jgi:hypothetical protein
MDLTPWIAGIAPTVVDVNHNKHRRHTIAGRYVDLVDSGQVVVIQDEVIVAGSKGASF